MARSNIRANSVAEFRNPKEAAAQQTVVQWLRLNQILFLATLNEGRHKVQYRAKQKRMGLAKGAPDLMIFDPPPAYPDCVGTAIEMKRAEGGRVSQEQIEWLGKLQGYRWYVAVCRGANEAIDLLERLGYGRRRVV